MTESSPRRLLTPKQKAWAEYYANHGNGTQAAREAGYKGSATAMRVQGTANLALPSVAAYLSTLTSPGTNSRIADATERQEFWSSVMRGEITEMYLKDGKLLEKPTDMNSRLKASELLGKRQGDFVDRLALTGADGGAVKIDVEHSLEGKTLEELAALYKSWG